MFKDYSEKSAN